MGAQYDSLGNYTGYTNDDGTAWSGFGEPSLSPTSVRPDLVAAANQTARERMLQLNNDPAFKQFTPEQAQAFLNFKGSPEDLAAYSRSISPFEKFGIYSDQSAGGNNMWFGPEAGPQHNDTGPEQMQTAWNDMRNGLAIMALPFAAAGGAALVGGEAAGAGAVGAGAAEGGAAATGVDASTGLFAGESATSGAAGAGATGTVSGGAGSASLVGGAGSDTAASMPAATAEDPFGGYNIDPETGDVFHGTGDNPFGSNFSGGTGSEGFSGYQPGFLEQAQSQATALAKQLGITPAAALQQILKAAGRAVPAALGVAGSLQQQDQFQRLADQYSSYGAPYRQRLANLYADPNSFLKSAEVTAPVQQASDIAAHSLSMGGNPIASGNSLQQLQDYSANQLFGRLGQEKDRLAGFGGLTQYNAAAPGAATNAINAGSNVFNALGAGAANVFNPPQTLAQQMAEFQRLSSGAVR